VDLPPDVQHVLDLAARLAGGVTRVRFFHVRAACGMVHPADPVAANDLLVLFLDHLQAELDAGIYAD
jgi:hypothetical protein